MLAIVFTGEVDSGKSTLIGRLLHDSGSITPAAQRELKEACDGLGKPLEFAYLLDSFQEERQDEFTLDTTSALLKYNNKELYLVDVPGHKELIKNMLTGASYADAACLVVDVKEPLGEQVKRHLMLLKFLGIEELVVAVNKIDLPLDASGAFNDIKGQITQLIRDAGLKINFIIPVSAKTGEGVLKYSSKPRYYDGPALIEALNSFTNKRKVYDFRFPVQDIYEIKNKKVAVGLVASGMVKRGDKVKSFPLGAEFKVGKIISFGKSKISARAAESVGLALNDPKGVRRGEILCSGRPAGVANSISAKIFCLSELNTGETLFIHCATQELKCSIIKVLEVLDIAAPKKGDASTFSVNGDNEKNRNVPFFLEALSAARVVIDIQGMLVTEKFKDLPWLGRFVLSKDSEICAAGIVY